MQFVRALTRPTGELAYIGDLGKTELMITVSKYSNLLDDELGKTDCILRM